MRKKLTLWSLSLLVAMALGTSWAVRGKFGHEQAAAWAGGVGALAIVLAAKREDWYAKAFRIILAGAFGWGIGGMISYGVVVGYGRASDFPNAYYGLTMLFVIGSLYGFIGGGLMGLALVDSNQFKIKWSHLLAEMIALGLLTYGLVINQLEWLMTPPRSELWAACFGAAIGVAWYIIRTKQQAVFKVAIWSSLGAGFGFAFGNVLQVMGSTLASPINLWNVMEYSIGFFGGLGMAYGTFTSDWPRPESTVPLTSNIIPALIAMALIPFVIWDQSFTTEKLRSLLDQGGSEAWIEIVKFVALASISFMAITVVRKDHKVTKTGIPYDFKSLHWIFIVYLGVYTLLSFLVTGVYHHPLEQYLYILNIVVFLIFIPRLNTSMGDNHDSLLLPLIAFLLIMSFLAVTALIMINAHGELRGSQIRFH